MVGNIYYNEDVEEMEEQGEMEPGDAGVMLGYNSL